MASHFRELTVKEIRRETAECVSIAFVVPQELQHEFSFRQGQNITIRTMVEKEEIRRSYSICSSPLENELRVAVKMVPAGKFSSLANEILKAGDTLEVLAPSGKFYCELHPEHKKTYLAFASGSGITPVISIIKTTLATEPGSNFTLIYGNRNRSSIIFKNELESLKDRYISRFSLHHILSREKTDAALNQGRITTEKCLQLDKKIFNLDTVDDIFICGPEEMTFGLKNWLDEKGIDKNKIHYELFNAPKLNNAVNFLSSKEPVGVEASAAISVKLDGIAFDFQLPYDGPSILDAALEQGADLPFSCKGGVCCTCKARLMEGKVRMDVNWGLEQDELDAGFILTCQSHPASEKIIVDYDLR